VSQVALFVRHRALPGRREDLRRAWEKHVRPRAAGNPGHLAYYFCLADEDADTICVFQLYADRATMEAFLAGDWYPAYLAEVTPLVAAPPELTTATPAWVKGAG
jgi:quinol monooxygenase YgiN